ncbi:hypothetical protein BDR03DRAFT_159847 [Suillus americanus]|nr:hypothetical protein BDR03DRAFT_159847 [Suillus americanus]
MDASTSSRQPDILAIAREQLGFQKYVKDASVPKSYLTALRRHLDIDPYDTNFRVTLQPKTGCMRSLLWMPKVAELSL